MQVKKRAPTSQQQKNILILHTGGTFGMQLKSGTAVPQASHNLLNDLLTAIPELAQIAQIELQILCNIDSSDATEALWIQLAKTIAQHWEQFDGFVIIHGTDTLAFTATALSFFLGDLTKSVVLTGSQRPLSALRNDARANMIDSVELATHGIPAVLVCFDSKVHLGTRVSKYSNEHLHAFCSDNAPLVAKIGVNFKIRPQIVKKLNKMPDSFSPPKLNLAIFPNIISLSCVPGSDLPAEFVRSLLGSFQGVLLQGFGAGNLPLNHWLKFCEAARTQKIPVVLASQCRSGTVSLEAYENGRAFARLGVISAKDMTFEAASVKLMVMLGRGVPFAQRHQFFSTPLAHECHD